MVASLVTHAHDVTTNVTWNRKSLESSTRDAPRATAPEWHVLADELSGGESLVEGDQGRGGTRSMPPWGAVKGFGSFRNDQALTQEEIDLVERWVNGGSPEGNPNDLPARPKIAPPPAVESRTSEARCFRRLHPAAAIRARWIRRSCPPSGGTARVTIGFLTAESHRWSGSTVIPRSGSSRFSCGASVDTGGGLNACLAGSTLVLLPPAHPLTSPGSRSTPPQSPQPTRASPPKHPVAPARAHRRVQHGAPGNVNGHGGRDDDGHSRHAGQCQHDLHRHEEKHQGHELGDHDAQRESQTDARGVLRRTAASAASRPQNRSRRSGRRCPGQPACLRRR